MATTMKVIKKLIISSISTERLRLSVANPSSACPFPASSPNNLHLRANSRQPNSTPLEQAINRHPFLAHQPSGNPVFPANTHHIVQCHIIVSFCKRFLPTDWQSRQKSSRAGLSKRQARRRMRKKNAAGTPRPVGPTNSVCDSVLCSVVWFEITT